MNNIVKYGVKKHQIVVLAFLLSILFQEDRDERKQEDKRPPLIEQHVLFFLFCLWASLAAHKLCMVCCFVLGFIPENGSSFLVYHCTEECRFVLATRVSPRFAVTKILNHCS